MQTPAIMPITHRQVTMPFVEAGLDWTRKSGSVLGHALDRDPTHTRLMQIALRDHNAWPPPFVVIGDQSAAARIIGSIAPDTLIGGFGVHDQVFEKQLTNIYAETDWTGRPAVELVSGRYTTPTNQRVYMQYERLVVPCEIANSERLAYAVFCEFRRMFQVAPEEEILRVKV